MGKLRDWWPSEDLLDRKNLPTAEDIPAAKDLLDRKNVAAASSPPATANSTVSSPSSSSAQQQQQQQHLSQLQSVSASASSPPACNSPMSAASVLRLSEVAAALNSMPNCTTSSSALQAFTDPQNHHAQQQLQLSRPVIKLSNTQEHKDELLRKLLSRSASSSDLQNMNSSTAGAPAVPTTKKPGAGAGSVLKSFAKSERTSSAFVAACGSPSDDSAPDQYRNKRAKRSAMTTTTHNTSLTLQTSTSTPNSLEEELPKESLSRREIHIFSERQRRKGMTHLYAILQSLLPDAKPKTDRCTVLTEAMDYINELQGKVEDLRKQRAELGEQLKVEMGDQAGGAGAGAGLLSPQEQAQAAAIAELDEEAREQILAAADVVVRFCGKDAFITLNSPKRRGVWSSILQILHEQHLELLNVTLSTSNDMDYHCIHAKISSSSEIHSHELQKILQDVVLTHAINILEE